MTTLRRRPLCITAGVIFVVAVLILSAVAFLPEFINTAQFKSTVQSQVSEQLGVQISYGRADLFFLPRPGVTLRDGTVTYRDRMSGSFGSLTVQLKILPLLRGSLGFSSIQVSAPKVRIRLEHPKDKKIPTLEELRQKLRHLLGVIEEKAPDLGVVMKKGSFTLLEGDQAVFSFADLDVDIVLPPSGLKVMITGSSDFAEEVRCLLKLDRASLSGRGEIALRQVRTQPLFSYFTPHAPVEVKGTGIDLNLTFKTADMQMIEGELSSSLSSVTLKRRGKELTIRGDNLKGDFRIRDDRTEASLRELDLSDPRLVLAGTLVLDRSGRQIGLNIEGRGIDVPSLRKAAYSFAGDIPI